MIVLKGVFRGLRRQAHEEMTLVKGLLEEFNLHLEDDPF